MRLQNYIIGNISELSGDSNHSRVYVSDMKDNSEITEALYYQQLIYHLLYIVQYNMREIY